MDIYIDTISLMTSPSNKQDWSNFRFGLLIKNKHS